MGGDEGTFGEEDLASDARAVVEIVKTLRSGDDNARFDLERIAIHLDRHQEQPELLDPYLADILQPLVKHMKHDADDAAMLAYVAKTLYVLITVRGYKTVVKFFPHEAADLE